MKHILPERCHTCGQLWPLGALMPDDTFEQFAEHVLRDQQQRLEQHEARLALADRNEARILDIASDIAITVEAELRTLLSAHEARTVQHEARLANSEAMLKILIAWQHHRSGEQTP